MPLLMVVLAWAATGEGECNAVHLKIYPHS